MELKGMKNIKLLFGLTAGFFFISAVSVLLTPFSVNENGSLETIGYVSGVLFWAGLILGIAAYLMLIREYKKMAVAEEVPKRKIYCYVGNNPVAAAADILFAVSLIVTIYAAVNIRFHQTAAQVFLFLLVVSFYAHFLFNGKVFRYLYRNNLRREKEGEAL